MKEEKILEQIKKLALKVIQSDGDDVEDYLGTTDGKFWAKIWIESDINLVQNGVNKISDTSYLVSPFGQLTKEDNNKGEKYTTLKDELGF